jgi:hypothetical protein
MKRSFCLKILTLIVLVSLISCSEKNRPDQGDQKNYSPALLQTNRLMRFFAEKHPQHAILKYAEADLDNDGKEDLIVIYQVAKGQNEMSVVLQRGVDCIETNSVPAPVSDQLIQFKDIDSKPPLEFIVQGRKGPKVGYAIFRVEDGKLEDLFGQGMEDCC